MGPISRILGSRVGHLGHDRPAIRNRLARRVRRDRRALRRRLRKWEQRSIRVRTELQRRGRDQPSRRRWGVRRGWFGALVPTPSCSQVGCVQPGARRHRWHDRNDVRVRATREQPVLLSGWMARSDCRGSGPAGACWSGEPFLRPTNKRWTSNHPPRFTGNAAVGPSSRRKPAGPEPRSRVRYQHPIPPSRPVSPAVDATERRRKAFGARAA